MNADFRPTGSNGAVEYPDQHPLFSQSSAVGAATRFAAQLLEEKPYQADFDIQESKNSKVLNLVMQVFSTMLNTTPSSFVDHTIAMPINYTLPTEEDSEIKFGVVPVIIIGVIFALLTTFGNALVMISIRMDKQLQTISNYFIFSLAVADITIGLISIPLMTYYSAHGKWNIGWGLCQFWLSVDYMMSNSSVYSLLLISFDRYFSITRPLTYRPRRTTRKALTAIFFAYLISIIIWPPFILGWPYIEGTTPVDDGTCMVQFLSSAIDGQNRWASQIATIATSVAAFYLPVSIMVYLYWRVYKETKLRQEQFRQLQAGQLNRMLQIRASIFNSDEHSQGSDPTDAVSNSESRRGSRISIRNAIEQVRKSGQGCFGCFFKIRGIGARNAFPNESSDSYNKDGKTKRTKQLFSLPESIGTSSKSKQKISWMKYCVGKAGNDSISEDSSEIIPTNGADWMSAKAEDANSIDCPVPQSPNTIITNTGSGRFRGRNADNPETAPMLTQQPPILHTYTVLIEYKDGESKRPSVRLSSCDSDCYTATPGNSNRSSSKRLLTGNEGNMNENGKRRQSLPQDNSVPILNTATVSKIGHQSQTQQNGKYTSIPNNQQDEIVRKKSEKERRKNERRQESKAAKTLSAILIAFIITWLPYNLFVCWSAFFPGSIPEILFTISYCLCYVNSTINPLCYSTNGQFLKTYKKIIFCRWRHGRRNDSLYRNAYLRRN